MTSTIKLCGYQDHHQLAVGQNIDIPEASLFLLATTDRKTKEKAGVVYGYNLTPRHPHIMWKFENWSMGQSFFDHYDPKILPFGYSITTRNFLSIILAAVGKEGYSIEVGRVPHGEKLEADQSAKMTKLKKGLVTNETRLEELGQLLMEHTHNEPNRIMRQIVIEEMIDVSKKMVLLYCLVDRTWMRKRAYG